MVIYRYIMSSSLIIGLEPHIVRGIVGSVPPALRGAIEGFLNGKVVQVEDTEGFVNNLSSIARDIEAGGLISAGEALAVMAGAVEAGLVIGGISKIRDISNGLSRLFGGENESIRDATREAIKIDIQQNPTKYIQEAQAGRAVLAEGAQRILDEMEQKEEKKFSDRTAPPSRFTSLPDDPRGGLRLRKPRVPVVDVFEDVPLLEQKQPEPEEVKDRTKEQKEGLGPGGAIATVAGALATGAGLSTLIEGPKELKGGKVEPPPPEGTPVPPQQPPPQQPTQQTMSDTPLGSRLRTMLGGGGGQINLSQMRNFQFPDDSKSYNYVDYVRAVNANNIFQNNLYNTNFTGR